VLIIATLEKVQQSNALVKPQCYSSLAYLSLLLLSLSADIELNPGPEPSYPCGSCGIDVLDSDQALECDECQTWHHIACQGVGDNTYNHLLNLDVSFSWMCTHCDSINISNISSTSSSPTSHPNSFSSLPHENPTPVIIKGKVKSKIPPYANLKVL